MDTRTLLGRKGNNIRMKIRTCAAAFLFAQALTGQAQTDSALSDLGGMMGEMTAGMTETGKVALVDATELQVLLPVALAGMRRLDVSSGRDEELAALRSWAKGRYEGRSGSIVEIEIMDMGKKGAKIAWTRMGFEIERARSDSSGIDRTWVYQGRPAVERYRMSRKTGDIHVLSADRFLVRISGTGIEGEVLRTGLQTIDLRKLDQRVPK